MSDNNLNNQQPGYENFNQYQQPVQAQPIYVAANGIGTSDDEAQAKKLGTWGLVLAIFSFCCCGITAFIGLGLSISGLKKNKGSTLCIIALILNILAICGMVFNGIYYATHPEILQQQMQQYQQMMEQLPQQAGQTAPQAGFIL